MTRQDIQDEVYHLITCEGVKGSLAYYQDMPRHDLRVVLSVLREARDYQRAHGNEMFANQLHSIACAMRAPNGSAAREYQMKCAGR